MEVVEVVRLGPVLEIKQEVMEVEEEVFHGFSKSEIPLPIIIKVIYVTF